MNRRDEHTDHQKVHIVSAFLENEEEELRLEGVPQGYTIRRKGK